MTAMTNNQDHLPTCKEMLTAKVERARPHFLPFCFMVVMVMSLYACSVLIEPGWLTWCFSTAALFVCGVSAVARLDDILPEQSSKRWQTRRFGLMLMGAACLGIAVGGPLRIMMDGRVLLTTDFPTWTEVCFRWGVALTFITTPHMPPFWRFVSGLYKTERDARRAAAATAIAGLYPTGNHQAVNLSPEMSDMVGAIQEAVAATPPPMREHEPHKTERRHGGDRREEGP